MIYGYGRKGDRALLALFAATACTRVSVESAGGTVHTENAVGMMRLDTVPGRVLRLPGSPAPPDDETR